MRRPAIKPHTIPYIHLAPLGERLRVGEQSSGMGVGGIEAPHYGKEGLGWLRKKKLRK